MNTYIGFDANYLRICTCEFVGLKPPLESTLTKKVDGDGASIRKFRRRYGGLMGRAKTAFLALATVLAATEAAYSQQFRFHLQEATIGDVHRVIREGQISCRGLVQLYINRAKA